MNSYLQMVAPSATWPTITCSLWWSKPLS